MKTPKTIRLSDQAQKNIRIIRERYPELNDTTAIERALNEYALTITTQPTSKRAKETK